MEVLRTIGRYVLDNILMLVALGFGASILGVLCGIFVRLNEARKMMPKQVEECARLMAEIMGNKFAVPIREYQERKTGKLESFLARKKANLEKIHAGTR